MHIINKNLKLYIILFILSSCGTHENNIQQSCSNINITGYISINIWNPKKGEKYRMQSAKKDAIYTFLYFGVNGSKNCITQPPLLKSKKTQDRFKKIEKTFFSKNGSWSKFVQNARVMIDKPKNLKTVTGKVYNVAVAKDELRKYLEKQAIINQLNEGF